MHKSVTFLKALVKYKADKSADPVVVYTPISVELHEGLKPAPNAFGGVDLVFILLESDTSQASSIVMLSTPSGSCRLIGC